MQADFLMDPFYVKVHIENFRVGCDIYLDREDCKVCSLLAPALGLCPYLKRAAY